MVEIIKSGMCIPIEHIYTGENEELTIDAP